MTCKAFVGVLSYKTSPRKKTVYLGTTCWFGDFVQRTTQIPSSKMEANWFMCRWERSCWQGKKKLIFVFRLKWKKNEVTELEKYELFFFFFSGTFTLCVVVVGRINEVILWEFIACVICKSIILVWFKNRFTDGLYAKQTRMAQNIP